MLDARFWLLWAMTTLVVTSSARNPLYVVVLLLATMVVGEICAPDDGRRAPLSPLRFAALAVPLSALFNGLTVHLGDTVLLTLPPWLPLIGGRITLEALTYGALNGLALTIIFAAFAVFNQVTPIRELIKLTPRSFHEGGVVLSIALTFIPQTTRSLRRIREAQAVRGHRVEGVRDWIPIVVPLLVSGLERAMGLAEAMVARGYGAVRDRKHALGTQWMLVGGLLMLLGGWLAYLFRTDWRVLAVVTMILGAAGIGLAAWLTGRGVRHSVYRPHRWTLKDTLATSGCLLTLALAVTQRESLHYSPYPVLELPRFDPLVGVALLGLVLPAVVGVTEQDDSEPKNRETARK